MEKNICISGLYYRYKRCSDDEIKNVLKKVKIVKKAEIGRSNSFAYYPLNKKSMKKIMDKPRNVSLTFDATETTTKAIKGLEVLQEVTFLVKSTSRFFLKPDIGELIDQIPWEQLIGSPDFHAICINEDYETLEETDGEHFLMTATLLKTASFISDVIAEKTLNS